MSSLCLPLPAEVNGKNGDVGSLETSVSSVRALAIEFLRSSKVPLQLETIVFGLRKLGFALLEELAWRERWFVSTVKVFFSN